jgi:hypothetical protein
MKMKEHDSAKEQREECISDQINWSRLVRALSVRIGCSFTASIGHHVDFDSYRQSGSDCKRWSDCACVIRPVDFGTFNGATVHLHTHSNSGGRWKLMAVFIPETEVISPAEFDNYETYKWVSGRTTKEDQIAATEKSQILTAICGSSANSRHKCERVAEAAMHSGTTVRFHINDGNTSATTLPANRWRSFGLMCTRQCCDAAGLEPSAIGVIGDCFELLFALSPPSM